jgi:hypothetical protein
VAIDRVSMESENDQELQEREREKEDRDMRKKGPRRPAR